MPNSTDPNSTGMERLSARVVLAVADHFTNVNPTEELEQHSLLIAFGAEAYKLTDRSIRSGADKLARAAFAVAPELVSGTTRGDYALILRRATAGAGHDWPDGDNDPAIPRITGIPGQRTQPAPSQKPAAPAASPAPESGA